MDIPGSRRAGRCVGARGGAGAATEHGGHARHQGLFDLLRADKVYVRINSPGGEQLPLARDGLGAWPNHDIHVGLHIRVAGLADTGDTTVLDAHIRFDDAPPVKNQRIGNDHVDHLRCTALTLAHAVANHLAATEFDFVSVAGPVLLNLYEKLTISQTHAVAGSWSVHLGIGLSAD